jgi:hypothetical protein
MVNTVAVIRRAILIVASSLVPSVMTAQHPQWSLEVFGGSALSLPTPLRIDQDGEASIRVTARYATRPWRDAPYYAYRVGRHSGSRGWELELVHHKLYLRDRPAEVQHFEVTHGYNLVLLNRVAHRGRWTGRIGFGPVLGHPENEVRGRRLAADRGGLGGGYYLSGAAGQVAGSHRLALGGGFSLVGEAKVTGAYARVPIAGGDATVPNVAAHWLVGVGYSRTLEHGS